MIKFGIFLFAFTACLSGWADTASTLSRFVGYTIIAAKTVDGYRDRNGKRGDSFEGCDYDRIIRFDDGTAVRCTGYGYSYAYRPTAVILVRGASAKMILDNDTYDVDLNLQ